jgi:hypothetical protein
MSLKGFHIVFVSVSLALAMGFGSWGLREYMGGGGAMMLVMTVGSFGGAVLLAIYGVWFLRKMRNVRTD